MRMFNADGSEAQMCGNGIRCVAKYIYDHDLIRTHTEFSVPGLGTFPTSLRIETERDVLTLGLDIDENDKVSRVCVNMGQPILDSAEIPVAADTDTVIDLPMAIEGQELSMTCVSMGNPHAVFFCDDVAAARNALIADVRGRAGNQLLCVLLRLAAEGAAQVAV